MCIARSKTLLHAGFREMGLELVTQSLEPFLCNNFTFAHFKLLGKTPFLKERLTNSARSALGAGVIVFTKVLVYLSQPDEDLF